jgi:hypothetical protein
VPGPDNILDVITIIYNKNIFPELNLFDYSGIEAHLE